MLFDLNFSHGDLAALAEAGLPLHGLSQSRTLDENSRFEGPTAVLARISQGAFVDIGAFCNLSGGTLNNFVAGRYCSIADGVVIGRHEHPTNWLTTSRTAYHPRVNGWSELILGEAANGLERRIRFYAGSCPLTTLGADVWIGQGAFIRAGVTIGTGAVIGARATVVKDVPPYAIAVGSPARVLRLRFPEALVVRLLTSQWWRYSLYAHILQVSR